MNKLCAVVVVPLLFFTSLACPTRTIQTEKDGGVGGSMGGAGGWGGVAGASFGGATGAPVGGAGGPTTGGVGAGGAGGAAGIPGAGGASGVSGTAGSGGTAGGGGTGGAGIGGTGGSTCTPNASCGTTCAPGAYSCTTGTAVCNQSNVSPGISCGSNLICDGGGNCVGKTADGGSCTNSQLCQNGNCAKSGSTGICCPANYVNCGGSCVNVQSDANNCGACGSGCQNGLVCLAGKCGCGSSTPNGVFCDLPGQTSGTCWKGACVLPAYFPGCNSAADCVPGGCTGPGGYCLGTVDVAGQVSCSDKSGWYVVCPTSQGCTANKGGRLPPFAVCGDGNGGVGGVTCDGPSDCAAGSDCCNIPGGSACVAQSQPGVIGSGCASLGPGNQLTTLCDPLNPTTNCAAGKSCMTYFGGVLASFDCE